MVRTWRGEVLHGFDYSGKAAGLAELAGRAELAKPGSNQLEMLCAGINMQRPKRGEWSGGRVGGRVDGGFSVGENDGGVRGGLVVVVDELLRLGCLV